MRRKREVLADVSTLAYGATTEAPDPLPYDLVRALDAAQYTATGVTAKGIAAIRLLAEGYTNREIGEQMGGVSANNVTAWVARARRFLRARPDIAELGEFYTRGSPGESARCLRQL